ncbi:MAG: methyl-accepting chemotaxis protein [Treponema sp.]|nr:methyl-accepting chemotaxis protein [Treponema sp.]
MAKKHKKLSFEKRVFLAIIPFNCIGALFILMYTINFVKFHRSDYLVATVLTIIHIFIGQLIIAPITHKISIARLSGKLEYYDTQKADRTERTELVKELVQYPIRKAIETMSIFLICTIGVSVFFHLLTDFSRRYTFIFLLVSTLSTYISFIFALDNTQKLCSIEAEKIAVDGLDTEVVDREHFFGQSLFTLFILYVFIPMILCSIFTLLEVIFLKSFRKLVSISIVNVIIISSLTMLFFQRIKRNSRKMEKALFELMRTSASSTNAFPTDFSSEMSYFTYLFNKTILLFQGLVSNVSQVNNDINESTTALGAISYETANTSLEQSSTSNEILTTMKNLNTSLSEVASKADEVLKVAQTTSYQVDDNIEILRQNSEMMKAIRDSNSITINGIQSLSNKINKIQDIVNLITTVTSQTKIIAFNAELEANGIDTEGADFQNVATDIRALADSTIKLTNEIQESIHEINKSNENLIKTGKDFTQRINEGSTISENLEQHFKYIKDAASETADEAKDIQQSIPEQLYSFQQIEGALQDINTRLNDINNSTRKISLSIDRLKLESGNLATMMLDMDGGI